MDFKKIPVIFIAGKKEVEAFFVDKIPEEKYSYQGWNYWSLPNFMVVHTGMGSINAACAAHAFLSHFNCSASIQIGLAGAHLESLRIGDILIGIKTKDYSSCDITKEGKLFPRAKSIQIENKEDQVIEFTADFNLKNIIAQLFELADVKFQNAVIGSADQFNRDPNHIRKINQVFDTWCEDMESAPVAQVCYRLRKPHLSIRIISNNELCVGERTTQGQELSQKSFNILSQLGQLFIDKFP